MTSLRASVFRGVPNCQHATRLMLQHKRSSVACRTQPDSKAALQTAIQQTIVEAKQAQTEAERAALWDSVEEMQAELAHKDAAEEKDPLERYCSEHPEADECRVYDD